MSFDKALICFGKGGIYAAPWLAATSGPQSLLKYYKSNDCNTVDIGKTCDALRLTLRKKSALRLRNLDAGGDAESRLASDGVIPFRICTNIWFGTLKIYQQQVNKLYKESLDLVVGSDKFATRQTSEKRRNDSNFKNPLEKTKLTVKNSCQLGVSDENYSELLEDLEKLTQQQVTDSQSEYEVCCPTLIPPPQITYMRPQAHIQIREITIREISATAYGVPELDDDDGFGEATAEEITQFFTFSTGNENISKKFPQKRKMDFEDHSPQKCTRFSNDATVEPDINRCIGSPLNGDFMPTPCRPRKSESIDEPVNFYEQTMINTNELNDIDVKREPWDNNVTATLKPGTSLDKSINAMENDFHKTCKIKRKSKLIIDSCIKIEKEDIMAQISAPLNISTAKIRESLKNQKYKNRAKPLELLKRLNKRTQRFTRVAKKEKPFISHSQFENEIIQLLREIYQADYKDEWPGEIFPQWINNSQSRQLINTNKFKRVQESLPMTYEKSAAYMNFLIENSYQVTYDELSKSGMEMENLITLNPRQCYNNYQNEVEKSNEWRPYGVMAKLLNIWRYCIETKIDIIDFVDSAKLVTEKALAFSSLLSLSKDQLIEITKRPQTILPDKILLGKAVNSSIKTGD